MLAFPIYWHVDPYFFQCAMLFHNDWPDVAARYDCAASMTIRFGDAAVGRLRNYLTSDFLDSDCTHMLFVDSDILFTADQIGRLASRDLDIVGGLYPKKAQGEVQWVLNTLPEQNSIGEDGLMEVRYIGTGFMCVARRVFERIIAEKGESIRYTDDCDGKKRYDFWSFGTYEYPDGSKRYLSEDWWFCQLARDLGFKVWADTNIRLKHSGSVVYPLQTQSTVENAKKWVATGSDSEAAPTLINQTAPVGA